MIDNETVRKLRQLDLSEFVDTLEMQEMDQPDTCLLTNAYRYPSITFTKKNTINE